MTHAPSAGVSLEERFAERLPALSHRQAAAEASRCLYCYDAPCVTACPTSIDVPSFIRMIGSGNRVGAARKILTRNPLGGTCARACPVEELCEGACVRATGGAPVAIGRLQRFATDVVGERPGGVLPRVLPAAADRRRGSVAIVGSGPAGLSAAIELARAGVRATVFESSAEPGGLCSHGIMPYRLPRGVVLAESEAARALGVEIRTGVTVGRDVTLRELADTHDALFLAIGLGAARPLGVPGEDLDGVLDALAFLRAVVTRPKDQVAIGRRVVVVGCGNTAMDTACSAALLGAEVTVAYRRSEGDVTAYASELEHAKSLGVRFLWHCAPRALLGGSRVEEVELLRMEPGAPDGSGRPSPVPVPGSAFRIPADAVVPALGQTPDDRPAGELGFATEHGRPLVDSEGRTSVPGVYAGGDWTNGGKEAVHAVAAGRDAAHAILADLPAEPPSRGEESTERGG